MVSGLLGERKRFTIRFTVVGIFILATFLTAAIAIGLQFYFSKSLTTESTLQYYDQAADNTSSYLTQIDTQAKNVTKLLASFDNLVVEENFNNDSIQTFAEVMRSTPLFYAIYVGLENGDFYELINLDAHPIIRTQLQASHQDRWVSITISGEGEQRKQLYQYLNKDFNVRTARSQPSEYDASQRPWFIDATEQTVSKTEPYLFQHLQAPGQTYSLKLPETGAVLAVDIALSTLNEHLITQGAGQSLGEIYLYKASGELIASNSQTQPQVMLPNGLPLPLTPTQRKLVDNTPELIISNETDWAPIDFAISGLPQGYSIDVINIVAKMTGLEFNFVNGFTWNELVDRYQREDIDILQSIIRTDSNEALGTFTDPFLDLSYAVVTRPDVETITDLAQLKGKRLAIPTGWSVISVVKQEFPDIEVVELASTQAILQAVENGDVYGALDNSIILHYTAQSYFIDELKYHEPVGLGVEVPTGLHMVMQGKNKPLASIINQALANITPEQRAALEKKWFARGELQSLTTQGTVPYELLVDMAADPKLQNQLIRTELNGFDQFIYVTSFGDSKNELMQDKFAIIVPAEVLLASSNSKVQKSILITIGCLLLILPVSWVFASPIIRPIKALGIENEKIKNRRYKEVVKVDTYIEEIDDLASSMVEMSSAIEQYEEEQKQLMEAFIRLIAQAIDDKSPYTAGHCNRVPELGLMLVEAASKSDLPPFKDFALKTEDEQREFRIAAWLHDCGKITTPEHIVDKGSKLEAIYNRIHEVRMRFEVLWRDAEIEQLKQSAQAPENAEQLKAESEKKQQQLTEDFAFIANANVGGEFMSQEHVDRLHQLAEKTWLRYFDDRLGLSPVEELNQPEEAAQLPVAEPLLSNKPHHIIKRDFPVQFDEKFGIKMDIPEHRYNQGELHNLAISRGTLTTEDRFKINEHITSTIKMLENLPFPPELAKVPRYASTHHETLKGSGYPRKLSAEDLSIPERILVVADIFEALTAADRPYKKAKPVSVAVDILHKMALDQHLDIEIFKLFLSSGIYLEYAHKFLDPKQIDAVDVSKYL
ncbi:transporter substrate-binding domain-containing protein [Shewanella canadensis]|uniref:Transporter substrate-binding domain-containing protein n=1 Tax=Shewanella canadensis TaxID=271096 RepID=A0A431WYM2_9GAMM|nr:HD domain-containing phosphohydrolase [Shewanella canadensis]RTR40581.1 transporter substrate-binding domain-containing protein [Shewanella canadensis]